MISSQRWHAFSCERAAAAAALGGLLIIRDASLEVAIVLELGFRVLRWSGHFLEVDLFFRLPNVGAAREVVLPPHHSSLPLGANSSVLHVTAEGEVMSTSQTKRTRERVDEHRRRLRQQGLRPIQIWAPDVRSPSFKREAHRQSLAVATGPQAREDQAFIDAVSDLGFDDGGEE